MSGSRLQADKILSARIFAQSAVEPRGCRPPLTSSTTSSSTSQSYAR